LSEIDVDNHEQNLVAGSFVQVKLKIIVPSYPQIPMQALVTRGSVHYVPVIHDHQHLELRKVEISENTGSFLKITNGLNEGEEVALNVGSEALSGQKVRPQGMAGQMNQRNGEKE
jgi:hypothetical protein